MYIGMSNDFYLPTKIASCAPGFNVIWKLRRILLSSYFRHVTLFNVKSHS